MGLFAGDAESTDTARDAGTLSKAIMGSTGDGDTPSCALQRNPHCLIFFHPKPTCSFVPCTTQGMFSSSLGTFGNRECFWSEVHRELEGGKRRMCQVRALGSVSLCQRAAWASLPNQTNRISEDAGELGKAQQKNQPWRTCWWQQTGWE